MFCLFLWGSQVDSTKEKKVTPLFCLFLWGRQVDWTKGKGVAKLQLRDARKDESVLLQICIGLDTCREQTECSFNRF